MAIGQGRSEACFTPVLGHSLHQGHKLFNFHTRERNNSPTSPVVYAIVEEPLPLPLPFPRRHDRSSHLLDASPRLTLTFYIHSGLTLSGLLARPCTLFAPLSLRLTTFLRVKLPGVRPPSFVWNSPNATLLNREKLTSHCTGTLYHHLNNRLVVLSLFDGPFA